MCTNTTNFVNFVLSNEKSFWVTTILKSLFFKVTISLVEIFAISHYCCLNEPVHVVKVSNLVSVELLTEKIASWFVCVDFCKQTLFVLVLYFINAFCNIWQLYLYGNFKHSRIRFIKNITWSFSNMPLGIVLNEPHSIKLVLLKSRGISKIVSIIFLSENFYSWNC